MVIGNGMIARRFADFQNDEDYIIFASGVSNSSNKLTEAFKREVLLLSDVINQYPGRCIVYFSTCSIYDVSLSTSLYVQHKLAIEALIKEKAEEYIIFRVSNPIGFTTNPHTVLNYFVQHITQRIPFEVWENASRNLIDINDMFLICLSLLKLKRKKKIYNIANPENYPVKQIVTAVENHFSVKGIYHSVAKGSSPAIDVSEIESMFWRNNIVFNEDYLEDLLKKYYPVA